MEVFSWLLVVLFFVFIVPLPLIKYYRDRKEVVSMTMEKFKEKFEQICASKDGAALSAFVKRNFVFILRHQKEVEELVRACSSASDEIKNNLEV